MENVATNQNNSSSEESLFNALAIQIQSKFDIVKYYSQRPLLQDRIICCVDPLLRQVNAAAYRPNFVIIGPLRCYETILEHIEIQKRICLASFLQRAEKKASLIDFFKLIKDSADRIHGCYEETYCRSWDFLSHVIQQNIPVNDGSSGLFIEMVLVDASFIIELFLRAYNKELERGEIDFIFNTPRKMHDIRRDLFLAHNQLPFFILKDMYELAFGGNPDFPSFIHLTCHFFSPYYNQNKPIEDIMLPNHCHYEYRAKLEGAKHFTDLLRTLQMPSSKKTEDSLEAGRVQGRYLYSAVLLRDAGVKFKVSTSRCLLDIEFNKKNGELKIPPLRVDESTESFFRNLMAWEQRYHSHETYLCDYIFLMEYLIKSTEDVDLLIRRRIIINQLGSNTRVVTLFNNFCKHITPMEKNHFSDIFRELNAYNAVRRHSWLAILRLQYFSTPWRGVATIAAVVLLVLTLIQTICALISL
ncbi:uncharacterized protein LOC111276620 [Durio zibethinus]|uniref:Uncharacterized protein LOC111276620 n=1 Tax=Durio zibethinus TaxID=66656 RepID=A0A6P5WRF4_DURZI|nr:uncharacterized protein LOC111276620 [Durio zibethinus]